MSESKSGTVPATISLADEEGVKRILVETLFSLWNMANNLSRLRPSECEHHAQWQLQCDAGG